MSPSLNERSRLIFTGTIYDPRLKHFLNLDANADEVGGGLNWYIHSHNLKSHFDVLRYNGALVSGNYAQLRPGDDGVLCRGQLQWLF